MRLSDGGTQKDRDTAYRMAGRDRRRGDMENPVARVSEESGEARLRASQLLDSTLPRKASKRVHLVTVP
jgi:hypothetical protein